MVRASKDLLKNEELGETYFEELKLPDKAKKVRNAQILGARNDAIDEERVAALGDTVEDEPASKA